MNTTAITPTSKLRQLASLALAALLGLAAVGCNKDEVPARVSGRVLWEDGEPATEVDLFFGWASYDNFTSISGGSQQVPIAANGAYSFIVPEMAGSRATNNFGPFVEINPDGGTPDTTYYCSDFPVPSHIDRRFLCDLPAEGEYDIDLILRR